MPSNKEHHFVPQFYLRRFARDGEKTVRSYVIQTRTVIPRAPIKTQCRAPYFYGTDPFREQSLAWLEQEAAPVIATTVEQERLPIGSELHKLIAFMSVQRARTPVAVELMNKHATNQVRAMFQSHPTFDEATKRSINTVNVTVGDALEQSILNAVMNLPTFYDLSAVVLRNETLDEFITSDAPVALHNLWTQAAWEHAPVGSAVAGLLVFLPLSRRHVLALFDREVYRVVGASNGFVSVRDERVVKQINSLQVTCANKCVFYSSERAAGKVVQLPWHLRDPLEDRVVVERYAADHGDSEMVLAYERQSRVRLSEDVFRVRSECVSVPIYERVMRQRSEAMETADWISRLSGMAPPEEPLDVSYTRVRK